MNKTFEEVEVLTHAKRSKRTREDLSTNEEQNPMKRYTSIFKEQKGVKNIL